MKKVTYSISIVLLIMFATVFNGCNKDSGTILGSLTCKVDGQEWKSTARVITMSAERIIIIASTGVSTDTGEIMTMSIEGVQEGTYTLSTLGTQFECLLAYKNSDGTFGSHTGSVTVSEIDTGSKKISGTFSFEVIDEGLAASQISITNGVFSNLKYSEI